MAKNNIFSEALSQVNDLKTLQKLHDDFNAVFESRRNYLTVLNESKQLKNNSFRFIKESFENFSPELFKTKKGRDVIKKYIAEHKNRPELQKMFAIYENMDKIGKDVDANYFVKEMIETVGKIDKKSLKEGIEKVGTIFEEAYNLLGNKSKGLISKNDDKTLDESVNYVFTNRKSIKNIAKYSECINEIAKYINSREIIKESTKPSKKNNVDIEKMISEIDEKYSPENIGLENSELLKEIVSSKDKQSVFERYKNDCLKTINEAIDKDNEQSVCDKLYEFKNKIELKNYNEKTINEDVSNFIYLSEMLQDE